MKVRLEVSQNVCEPEICGPAHWVRRGGGAVVFERRRPTVPGGTAVIKAEPGDIVALVYVRMIDGTSVKGRNWFRVNGTGKLMPIEEYHAVRKLQGRARKAERDKRLSNMQPMERLLHQAARGGAA